MHVPQTLPEERAAEAALDASTVFARILIPIDFSPACRRAVVVAYDLAKKYGSEVHVFNLARFGENSEFLAGLGAPANRDDVQRDACAHIQDYIETVVPGAPPWASCDVDMGDDLVEGVAAAVRKSRATCIVLAVHMHARKPLFRTRAEKIVRAVACPVLLVQAPAEPVVYYD